MPTKEERASKYGPSLWVSRTEAAAIDGSSVWKIDQGIKAGKFIVRKDEDTGAVKIWRASVEKNPKDSEFEPPSAA
jgi:hypothetical protein